MSTRGGWMPGTLRFAGSLLIALASVSLLARYAAEGMLNGLPTIYPIPVAAGMIALGVLLLWLARR